MKHLTFFISISIFFFTHAFGSPAADTTNVPSIFEDFYQPDKVVEVTLQFDCKQLIRNKSKQEELPATLTYQRPNGKSVTRSLNITTRGKLRLDICGFPPLKLDFDKKELAAAGFSSAIDEVKVVTHCTDDKRADQVVIKEFLTYQLYNIIEKYSYRVQLLHVRYLDKDGKLYADNIAFLIEPTDAMAARLECRESERKIENESEMHPDIYADMLLFEYMIGNVDWNISMLHNVKLIKPLAGFFCIPVPYDFDFSGLVSAQYAAPQERVKQTYVGERMLMGKFLSDAAFNASLQRFITAKQQIYDTCANFAALDKKERERINRYLNSFYAQIEQKNMNPSKL